MIVAALLLQAAADTVVAAPSLDRFRGQVAFGKAGPECRVKASTGDAEIDRIGCDAITLCYPPYQSRYAATDDRAIKPSTRRTMRAALEQDLHACFDSETKADLAALSAKRAGAR